jgi:hypothetical protein
LELAAGIFYGRGVALHADLGITLILGLQANLYDDLINPYKETPYAPQKLDCVCRHRAHRCGFFKQCGVCTVVAHPAHQAGRAVPTGWTD